MEINFAYELDQIQQQQWECYWNKCQHSHPRQHYLFGEIERAKKRIPIFASAKVGGKLVCIALFSIHPLFFAKRFSFEAVCLRGPAFNDLKYLEDFLIEVIRKFKAINVGNVRISPYWVFPEANSVENLLEKLHFVPCRGKGNTRSFTGLVDVCHDDEGILAAFSKNTRKQFRLAQKNNIVVRPASTLEEAELFFREVNLLAKERNFPMLSVRENRFMFQKIFLEQEKGIILNVFLGSDFLGGLSLIRSVDTAHTRHFAIAKKSLGKQSNIRIAPLVWWYGMRWARDHGCKWVDVGGYREDADESHYYHQIYAYKRGFRPKEIQIIAEHKYVCNPFVSMLHLLFVSISRKVGVFGSLSYHIGKRKKNRKVLRQLREVYKN